MTEYGRVIVRPKNGWGERAVATPPPVVKEEVADVELNRATRMLITAVSVLIALGAALITLPCSFIWLFNDYYNHLKGG